MSDEQHVERRGRKPKTPLQKWKYQTVQVVSQEDPAFGVTFQVGDVQGDLVHGFIMLPGGAKEFVTTSIGHIELVGKSKLTSRTPCSDDWIAKYETKPQETQTQSEESVPQE